MKKLFYLGIFAAAALTFSACQKEEQTEVIETVKKQVTFTFTAEKVVDTRTAAVQGENSVSYNWTAEDEDNIRLIQTVTDGEGTRRVLVPEGNVVVTKVTDKKLTISATVAEADSYTFRAILAKSLTSSNNPRTQAIQSPNGLENFDPNADVLVSEEVTTDSPSNMMLSFTRKAVINKMTINGLPDDILVSKVIISSTKDLVGSYDVNQNQDNYSGSSNEITLNYSNQALDENNQFPVYFVSIPNTEHTLTVKVYAGNMIYYKTFGGGNIAFNGGSFTRFGVSNLSSMVNPDVSGTYILANSDGSFMANAYNNGNNIPAVQTIQEEGDNTNYYDPDVVDIDEAKVTLAKVEGTELYTMVQNGKYLYAAGTGNNHLKAANQIPESDNGGYYWSISLVNGAWSAIANRTEYSNTLQYNSGNSVFSCYESASQTAIAFLRLESFAPTPVITAADFSIAADAVSSTNTGATFNSNTSTVTATAYDDVDLTTTSTWLTVSVNGTTVNYAAAANTGNERIGYIKITATNSDSHSVEKVITVTQANPGSTNLEDILNQSWTGISGTSYSSATNLDGSASDAVYSVQCAGGNSSIQLRSKNSNSGIVTTKSGGYVRKVTVTWESNTSSGSTLQIYGKSTAYSAPSDLYDSSTRGTLIGTLVCGTSTILTISDDYEFIGLRSASGAMYLSEVKIEWEPVSGGSTYDFTTIAGLNTLAAPLSHNGTANYSGQLTDVVVSYVPNTTNAIIKDASGSILVYRDHNLLQGQTFSGDLNVTVKKYYSTIEITAIDASFSGSQAEVLPAEMTLDQLVGNFSTYQNTYVKVEGLTVTERTDKTLSVSSGDKTYVVYDNEGSSTAMAGHIITAIGTVADHNGTNQIKVWDSDNITVTGFAPKAITFNQPTSGGSFTVTAGGSTITSGTTVASGTTVTLTATAQTGYTFNGWTVTGATVADASASSTTFTMENSDVSISASFTTSGGDEPTEQTIFLETFGSTSSSTAFASYTGFTATTSMFTTTGTVTSHYSGSGSVGKNNLADANLSNGYDGASGLSGCYHGGIANTTTTILQISNINIEGCTNLSLSFGALGGSSSHKIDVSYIIDNGSETPLITNGSITNNGWTLLSQNIPSTGSSLTLIFKHTPTKGWTIRLDDIKVVGTR